MKKIALALLALLWTTSVWAATLLPNGRQQFINGNGAPLARGKVYFYVPSTTTPKSTWQDPDQTILNQNPVPLDANGYATIYGSGSYRQIVKDALGNTVWDTLTADTSANGPQWAGSSSGTANAQSVTVGAFTATDGQSLAFVAAFTNTGSMTLSVNGATYNVYKDMATGPSALNGGEVVAQNVVSFLYDQSLGGFHLVNPAQSASTSQTAATLASGAVADLGSAGSTNITITGTTTISGFGASASVATPFYNVTFQSPLQLTYNATSMILPGLGNLAVGAGDSLVAKYLGAGNWQVVSFLSASSPGVITGEVRAFAMNSCPGGFLAGDGSAISRTTYAGLFTAVGTTWGTGDGATTFNLPDFRGQFLRGYDDGGTVDPGRVFGVAQLDAFQGHLFSLLLALTVSYSGGSQPVLNGSGAPNTGAITGPVSDGTNGTPRVAKETRPVNQTVKFCIKY